MIAGMTCAGCVFYAPPFHQQRGRVVFGQCRRHAPVHDLTGDRPRTIWPMVADDAWCGEHSTLEEQA